MLPRRLALGEADQHKGVLMAEAANYIVVLQGGNTLPNLDTSPADVDFEYPTFSAPGLSNSQALADRPFLLFQVDPSQDDSTVRLTLNGTVVYEDRFSAGSPSSINEVLNHGDLLTNGNELKATIIGSGSFTISDMTVGYKVNV
jgi:hypothetical protein